jgi:hypothetical protein
MKYKADPEGGGIVCPLARIMFAKTNKRIIKRENIFLILDY